jgi:hypothetical protein
MTYDEKDGNEKNKNVPATSAAGQSDGVDTPDEGGGSIIEGHKIAFTNNATWINAKTEEVLPKKLRLLAAKFTRVVQKWLPNAKGKLVPVETRVLDDTESYKDIDIEAMNAQEPAENKHEAFGRTNVGPYEKAHVVYFMDPVTKAAFTYVTSTIGGRIAVEELKKAIRRERKLNGPNRYALVEFSDTFMDTGWGGRQRPDLVVVDFVSIGGAPAQLPQLAAEPEKPAIKKPAPRKPRHDDDLDDDINF